MALGAPAAAPTGHPPAAGTRDRVALGALLAVLLLAVAAVVAYSVLALRHPWDSPFIVGETNDLWHADRLAHGHGLYRHWSEGRWIYPIYAPGMYILLAPLTLAWRAALWPGRVLGIGGMTLAAVLAGVTARRLGCGRALAWCSGLGFLSFTFLAQIVPAIRPDEPVLALSAATLWTTTVWEDTRRRGYLAAAMLLSVAVVATRQNYLPLVAAVALAIALRDRRAAVRYLVGVAVVGLVLVGVIQLLSGGTFITDMRAFGTGFSLRALRSAVRGGLRPFPNPLLAVGGVAVLVGLRRWRTLRAVELAWLAGLGVLLSAVKVGSAANYWALIALASAMLLGPTLARLMSASVPWVFPAVVALVAVALLPGTLDELRGLRGQRRDLASFKSADRAAVAELRARPGRVLADRLDLVLAAHRTPEFEPFTFSGMADAGDWDPADVGRAVAAHEFAVVQSSFDLRAELPSYQGQPYWPPAVAQAVSRSYCLAWNRSAAHGAATGIWLYTPC